MALPFLNSPMELNEAHDHINPLFFLLGTPQASSSSSSSISCPIFSKPAQDHGVSSYINRSSDSQKFQLRHDQADLNVPKVGSCNIIDQSSPENQDQAEIRGLRFTIWKKEDGNYESSGENNGSANSVVKWMPSKIRLMRKMMTTSDQDRQKEVDTELQIINGTTQMIKFEDHDQNQKKTTISHNNLDMTNTNIVNNTIRVCSDCNTSKTPLWRSGPRGPKSLCNACGIRQRKARRAMAAAAAATATATGAANGNTINHEFDKPAGTSSAHAIKANKVHHKIKKTQLKKRSKVLNSQSRSIINIDHQKKLCFEDHIVSLSKNVSAFQRVFPQDEKEAAILLMALSYGLVHG